MKLISIVQTCVLYFGKLIKIKFSKLILLTRFKLVYVQIMPYYR